MKDYKLSELKAMCNNGKTCEECEFWGKGEGCFLINNTPNNWRDIKETQKTEPSKQDLIKETQKPSLAKFVYLGNDNVIINTDEIAYIYRDNKTCITYKDGQQIYVETGVSEILKIIYQLD